MSGRGDDVLRPNPWRVRFADRRAAQGWQNLVTQAMENTDRAWAPEANRPLIPVTTHVPPAWLHGRPNGDIVQGGGAGPAGPGWAKLTPCD